MFQPRPRGHLRTRALTRPALCRGRPVTPSPRPWSQTRTYSHCNCLNSDLKTCERSWRLSPESKLGRIVLDEVKVCRNILEIHMEYISACFKRGDVTATFEHPVVRLSPSQSEWGEQNVLVLMDTLCVFSGFTLSSMSATLRAWTRCK